MVKLMKLVLPQDQTNGIQIINRTKNNIINIKVVDFEIVPKSSINLEDQCLFNWIRTLFAK